MSNKTSQVRLGVGAGEGQARRVVLAFDDILEWSIETANPWLLVHWNASKTPGNIQIFLPYIDLPYMKPHVWGMPFLHGSVPWQLGIFQVF